MIRKHFRLAKNVRILGYRINIVCDWDQDESNEISLNSFDFINFLKSNKKMEK